MSGDVFASIREDIHIIHNTIKNQLSIKAGHVGDYAHLEFTPLDNFIRPAVVLIGARLYNCRSAKVHSLGAIVQFIFMASNIHKQIPDMQVEHEDPRDGTQFPVLVGDFLYGKFFTTLSNHNILQYLRPLAEIIGHIHEGGILDKTQKSENNNQLVNDIVRLETAELIAGAARMSANLAGAPEEDQKLLFEYGMNLGMLYGLMQSEKFSNNYLKYYDAALAVLDKLPNRPERAMLQELVQMVRAAQGDIRKVV